MARGRAAPRSSASAASRPRPAASPSSSHSSPPPQRPTSSYSSQPSAPAPMHSAPAAAPPAMSSGGGGGGMMSGLMGSVVSGMAMGTGSAVAHRAVDSMMGPRETVVRHEGQEPAPAAAAPAALSAGGGGCTEYVTRFTDCMTKSNNDMGACEFYLNQMKECQKA
eukprot:gene19088-25689_t